MSIGKELLICAVLAAIVTATAAAQQSNCAPPAEMKAKLTTHPDVDTLNDLGVWFGEHQNYNCAAEAFATSLQTDPAQKDLSHVAFLFGASLYYTGNVSEGVTALREAERLGYRHVRLHMTLAEALRTQKDYDGAIAEWRRALEYEPESAGIVDALSGDLLATERYHEVIRLLRSSRLKPQRTQPQFLNLAEAYEKSGKEQKAAKVLGQALNTYPDSAEIARQLAQVLRDLGRDAESARVLELAEAQGAASH